MPWRISEGMVENPVGMPFEQIRAGGLNPGMCVGLQIGRRHRRQCGVAFQTETGQAAEACGQAQQAGASPGASFQHMIAAGCRHAGCQEYRFQPSAIPGVQLSVAHAAA
jgi:hypothetical protein